MLTYKDLAEQLGIKRGTLSRKILLYNKQATAVGAKTIEPDEKWPTKTLIHLFKPERIQEIKDALDSLKTRGRGKPRKETA